MHDLDDIQSSSIQAVESITLHNSYNPNSMVCFSLTLVTLVLVAESDSRHTQENDIALIKLTTCVSPSIPTIQLDDRSETRLFQDFASTGGHGLAAIMGLGALSSNGPSPRELREARQRVLRHNDCQSEFGRTPIDPASMICGSIENPGNVGNGVGNVDTCQVSQSLCAPSGSCIDSQKTWECCREILEARLSLATRATRAAGF